MQLPSVSIIIVQHNNSRDTIGCLENVKELNYPDYNVTVIDNASDIKDFNTARLFIESLRDRRFKIIHSDKNLGYAGGNNLGIKKALESGADYFFILNPDTGLEGDALTKSVEAADADPEIGIVGPAINENGRTVYGGKLAWLKPELRHENLAPNAQNPEADYIIGAAMLIKKEVIEKIGLLDERYFLYFEDADYCLQAGRAGYKLAIEPKAKVSHAVSASTGRLGSALLLRYHYRNAHLFNLKNGPWYVKLALPFWSFFIIIKQLIKMVLMPGRREISRAILAGIRDFYTRRFGKINELNA